VSRMSPSMAVALLALFVALGGTGYAAAKINGRDIRNRSIPGTKLQRNTLSGAQIRESRLGKVPAASDADFLAGRPAGAYLLAGTGVAANSLRLGGKDASAFLPAGGTAANAALLGGLPASAFLGAGARAADSALLGGRAPSDFLAAGGTAVDADKLDGKDAADFVATGKVQGAGPLAIDMPAANGTTTETALISNGPLTIVGQCSNSGGVPVARIGLRHPTIEVFNHFGEGANNPGVLGASGAVETIVSVTTTGGTWNMDSEPFFVVSNPPSGSAAIQGGATAITQNTTHRCYLGAWGIAS
jgi:hypothetical protein